MHTYEWEYVIAAKYQPTKRNIQWQISLKQNDNDREKWIKCIAYQGPLLLTWFNFNSSMDK